ncbi:GNAT family N-acetyltransferase [Paenibacillus sp. Marseille-Q4541]|uniref:GNAT family N-acetyltransferase n=1 Tax=Paenibacillus sp. Marseille-Q4541 TaxID=2831522 RepID=UPI001BACAF43|nr:GNAT family N-acetyltransferase [Paenibacillus sp. Marseille-Q4541]
MEQIQVIPYEDSFHEQVVQLYQAVTAKYKHACFWWPGPKPNHENVYCAFAGDLLIGKGQVEIISIQSLDEASGGAESSVRTEESFHHIYLNIKVRPDVFAQQEVFQSLYSAVYERALVLAQGLPKTHPVQICVGNNEEETENSNLFVKNGFTPLYRQYEMERELYDMQEAPDFCIPELHFIQSAIESMEEEQRYLRTESTIWPQSPLGLHRLRWLKGKAHFTSFAAYDTEQELVASIIVCQEDETLGAVEEVFVVPAWQKKGIATHLIKCGLKYLQEKGYPKAMLCVQAENDNALELYRALGFAISGEEHRYSKPLV